MAETGASSRSELLTPEQRRRFAVPTVEQRLCHERWLLRAFPALAALGRLERERLVRPAFDASFRLKWAASVLGVGLVASPLLAALAKNVSPLVGFVAWFAAFAIGMEIARRRWMWLAVGRRLLEVERAR